jgi:hypothetical protein
MQDDDQCGRVNEDLIGGIEDVDKQKHDGSHVQPECIPQW